MGMRSIRSISLKSGFVEDGRRYVLRNPYLLNRADADLWNDRLYVQIDHRGRCDAWFLQPNPTRYAESLRSFYIRDDDTGHFWSVPYEPVQADPEEFEFSVGRADLRWRVVRDGLDVSLRLVVPRDDTVELWTATVCNRGRRPRRISLFSFMPVGSLGPLVHQAWYDDALCGMIHDYFPYYVRWQDYYRLRELKNRVFCAADVTPTSYEVNRDAFQGGRGLHDPAGLRQKQLGGGRACHEPSAAVFQFTRVLRPGRDVTVNLVFGPASDRAEMRRLKETYLRKGGIEEALRRVEAFLAEHAPAVRIVTPDADFNHYVNWWQSRRALLIGRTMRLTCCPQGRNAIQDCMGAVYTNPIDARRWLLRIFALQHADGWMPHGLPLADGVEMMPIGTIPHRDTVTWGAAAVHFYVCETGDRGVLDEPVPFADRPEPAPLYDHICRALEWSMADRTKRGLSRLGEGDWDDPLNMAGKEGRGESVWLTEALAFALDTWAEVAQKRGDPDRAARYRAEAEKCRGAVNRHAWDGRWYARGTTDAGRWFGVHTDREARIFLNPQSWAILCGAAAGERLESCVASIRKYLSTPCGPMLLDPPFAGMQEEIGKLTQKAPGTGENGSVYCHAVTFYAFALLKARRAEEGYRLLRNLLTGTRDNPIHRSGQLPLFIPNYYRGAGAGASAGRSSQSPNTGTSAWYYRTVVSLLMGVRGEWDGLRIDPQLPRAWPRARVWRRWCGAEFDIEIRRTRRAGAVRVTLDGRELPDNLVPPQPEGSSHEVRIALPSG
jgi:cellobionic acid phosphorylase